MCVESEPRIQGGEDLVSLWVGCGLRLCPRLCPFLVSASVQLLTCVGVLLTFKHPRTHTHTHTRARARIRVQ